VSTSSSSHPRGRRYCLITPCRDEEQYAHRTIESVLRQTIRPTLWVIVDDGSHDNTPKILAEYAAKYPFIRVMTRQDRGMRMLGAGVIEARVAITRSLGRLWINSFEIIEYGPD